MYKPTTVMQTTPEGAAICFAKSDTTSVPSLMHPHRTKADPQSA
jgi:hypothetical protein